MLTAWWGRWRSLASLALIPLGLGLYMLYLDARFGHPLIFSDILNAWGRNTSLQGAVARIQELLTDPNLAERVSRSGIDLIFMALGVIVLLAMQQKLRLSYFVYAAYCLLTPLASLQVVSLPRYIVVIFPFFLLLALYLRGKMVFRMTVTAFAVLQIIFVTRWSLWHWVA